MIQLRYILKVIINLLCLFTFIYIVGPNNSWARPIYFSGSKGPSRGGLWPRLGNTSTRWPWDTAEDDSILGMSKISREERAKMV